MEKKMDIRKYNQAAWDREVEKKNPWTIPVTHEVISAASQGDWQIILTPSIAVPRDWFPGVMEGVETLCLASGGGQQGPVLAAAGAKVTILDNSPKQLAQDQSVAEREGLSLQTVEGDMRDLSAFKNARFDLIVHPVSNPFIPEVQPVWEEAFRVLKPGGILLSGFTNPVIYLFDMGDLEKGKFTVRFKLPYSDLESLPAEELKQYMQSGAPVEFSHSLEELLGGQIRAGFYLSGIYEDRDPTGVLDAYLPLFIATRAIKPSE